MNLEAYLRTGRERMDRALEDLLPHPEGPGATVHRAMRYAVLGGGKRLRPILALAACEALGGRAEAALEPAAALEMVHAYSLVHDDLPAMDDDDLRRGRPTVHRAFGEAEAILAGDGLLTLAFEVLASRPAGDEHAARRAAAVAAVARAAGAAGMVGGQQADLEAEGRSPDAARLEWIHGRKTGALLSASAEVGAIHAGGGPRERGVLARFGGDIGLAFQITDDILDQTATRETLGKTPGKDRRAGKTTYPTLFGVEGSHRMAESLVERALLELAALGPPDPRLEALAFYAVRRDR